MALYQIVPTGSFSDIKKKKKKLPKKMSWFKVYVEHPSELLNVAEEESEIP